MHLISHFLLVFCFSRARQDSDAEQSLPIEAPHRCLGASVPGQNGESTAELKACSRRGDTTERVATFNSGRQPDLVTRRPSSST